MTPLRKRGIGARGPRPNETVVPGQTVSRTDNAHFHAEITQHLCIIHPNVMVRNDDVQ